MGRTLLSGTTTVRWFTAPARFEVPALPVAYVPRPDLVQRLERSTARLTVVVGSIGAGKTALISDWASTRAGTTVWMACDPTDADPLRFWSALTEAVQRAAPDAGLDALARLDEEREESIDAAASLGTDCGALDDGVVVIDDFHLSGTSPAALLAFVRSLPGGTRLVLASRRDPPFSLERLRVQGEVVEIRDHDLGFDVPEARQLFDELGIEVGEKDLVRLCDLTEGWAAGLQLAALSMAARGDGTDFVDEFAVTDRGVADFLVNEVLDQQPPDVAEFLMRTSVLDSFDASLCTAVTGRGDAGALLSTLRGAHLFVTELDDRTGWYRYHHLFRAFLRVRLRAQSEAGFRAAHLAASAALAERGDTMGAVDHAMAAGEMRRAIDLIRELALSQLDLENRNAYLDTIRSWLRQHGADAVVTDPRIVAESCIWLVAVGAPDDVTVWLRRLERSPALDADPNCRALLAAAYGLHATQHGDAEEALRRTDEALAAIREADDPWTAQWSSVSCPAHLLLDDTDAVRRDIARSRDVSAAVPVLDAVRMPGFLAWAAWIDGEVGEAERQAALALDAADALGLARSNYGRVLPLLTAAAVAYERNDLDDAVARTAVAVEAGEVARRPPALLHCVLHQAQLRRSMGDVEAAHASLERARRLFPDAGPVVTDRIDRVDAAIAVAAGNPKAAALVDGLLPTPYRALLEVRLLLQQGDARAAIAVLDEHRDEPRHRRLEVQHALLEARALSRTNRDRAVARLREGLVLAQPAGLLRTVIDEGAEVHGLLEALPVDAGLGPFVAQVLDAVYRHPVARRPADRAQVDGLSEREHEVLRYLASRLSYSEMAGELFISVNTLKSHLKAVYRKLGVSTRAEAVQSARRSGLL